MVGSTLVSHAWPSVVFDSEDTSQLSTPLLSLVMLAVLGYQGWLSLLSLVTLAVTGDPSMSAHTFVSMSRLIHCMEARRAMKYKIHT